jgi:hypothetical protein
MSVRCTRRQALTLFAAAIAGCRKSTPPLPAEVNGCTLDPDRQALFAACTASSGPFDVKDEWDHAVLHPHTAVYSCGRPARPGGPNEHDHPPGEIELGRRLSAQAAERLKGLDAVGSEGDGGYVPFFLTANRADPVPDAITPELVRRLFGGVIYPQAEIVVEPLEERGKWWESVRFYFGYNPDGTHRNPANKKAHDAGIDQWRAFARWFRELKELRGPCYVAIGEHPLSETNLACVFPRLHVGLTPAGSLVGT